MVGIISVVIGDHFGGGDHFDGGDHFGGGTGLKETIELMLIRPPQLQFFEDGVKITATDTM